MQLNETNAQRVADVYSNLAAKSASNVDELSTAMTKVASLANSAGMTFENTAGFLATIIESTRESAETAGTALKTVIARFAEVKNNPAEIRDVEGEEVAYNKIDTALKSVGISMEAFMQGQEGLDQVLMRLAEKWDTLDTVTQRYIATEAAGSRQQSRFIALMADYSRQQELVGYANNAAGASAEQYGKTLESLQTKLNRLKDSWDNFILGITNSKVIKFAVDALNALLTVINKLTDILPGFGGSLLKILFSLGSFKMLKSLYQGFDSSFRKLGKVSGVSFGQGFSNALKTNFKNIGIIASKSFWSGMTVNDQSKKFIKQLEQNISGPTLLKSTSINGFTSNIYSSSPDPEQIKASQNAIDLLNNSTYNQKAAILSANEALKSLNLTTEKSITADQMSRIAKADNLEVTIGEIAGELRLEGAEKDEFIQRTKNNFATQTSIAARVKQTLVTIGATVAEKIFKMETIKTTAALLLGVLVIALFIGAIIGLIAIFKRIKKNSPEESLKRAGEATKAAGEQADSAAQQYDSLMESISNIDEKTDALSKLAEGTLEYTNALIDINNEVLSLTELYPALLDASNNYIETTENGLLKLTQAGKDYIETQALAAKASTSAAYAAAQVTENQAKSDVLLKQSKTNFNRSIIGGGNNVGGGNSESMLTTNDMNKLRDILIDNNTILTERSESGQIDYNKFISQLKASGFNQEQIDALMEDTNALRDLQSQLIANESATNMLTKAMVAAANENNQDYKDSQNKDILNEIGAKQAQEAADKASPGNKEQNKEYFNSEAFLRWKFGDEWDSYEYKNTGGRYMTLYKDGERQGDKRSIEMIDLKKEYEAYKASKLDYDTIQQVDTEVQKYYDNLTSQIADETTRLKVAQAQYRVENGMTDNLTLSGIGFTKQELLDIVKTTSGEVAEAAKAAYAEQASQVIEQNSQFNEQQTDAEDLSAAINAAGMTEDAYNGLYASIINTNEALKDNDELAQHVVYDTIRLGNALNHAADVYKNNTDALNDTTKSTQAYWQACGELVSSVSELVGTSVDAEFVSKNLDKIKAAIEGDTKALADLQILGAEQIIIGLDAPTEDIDFLRNELESINGFEVQTGATLDNTDFIKKMNEMLADGSMTAEQMNKIFGQIGYEPTVTTQTVYQRSEHKIFWPGTNHKIFGWDQEDSLEVPFIEGAEAVGNIPIKRAAQNTKITNAGATGSSSSEEPWENSYDWLYNLTKKINKELNERNRLEKQYDILVKKSAGDMSAIYENIKDQYKNLYEQEAYYQELIDKRQQEAQIAASQSGLSNYAYIKDGQVWINNQALDSVTDQDKGQEIQDYISQLENIVDEIDDAQSALLDIEDQIYELQRQGRDEYIDLQNRVADAIKTLDQNYIDQLGKINDTISESASNITTAISKSISKLRQDRDNANTESDLAQKQARLAYLKQDTSGANQMAILQLEKEIQDAQQDYTDSLVDQALSQLEEQNDEAQKAREKQIDLLEKQLEWNEESGYYLKEADEVIQECYDDNGNWSVQDSRLYEYLSSAENWDAQTAVMQEKTLEELTQQMNMVGTYFMQVDASVQAASEAITSAVVNSSYQYKSGSSESSGSGSGTEEAAVSPVTPSGSDDDVRAIQTYLRNNGAVTLTIDGIWGSQTAGAAYDRWGVSTFDDALKAYEKELKKVYPKNLNPAGKFTGVSRSDFPSPISNMETITYQGIKYYKSNLTDNAGHAIWFQKYVQGKNREDLYGYTYYKTGGLADFTGPAWLDGTKSKPEMVLNARDTENFIQLKDILSQLLTNSTSTGTASGDNYYDININVDEITSDYDVDQMADRIKKIIYNDGMYRNVNTINLIR